MYQDLHGKVAIITGGSSGIGAAVAERLGQEGMSVVINYHSNKDDAQKVANIVEQSGGKAVIYQGDISDELHANQVIETALDSFGRLDLLVNNAGIEFQKPTHEVDLAQWEQVISVNLTSFFLRLKRRSITLLNIISRALLLICHQSMKLFLGRHLSVMPPVKVACEC